MELVEKTLAGLVEADAVGAGGILPISRQPAGSRDRREEEGEALQGIALFSDAVIASPVKLTALKNREGAAADVTAARNAVFDKSPFNSRLASLLPAADHSSGKMPSTMEEDLQLEVFLQ